MKTILAIHSYPGANKTVERHWPFFLNQEADEIWGIGTTDAKCEWPEGACEMFVGIDSYIDGPVLPRRMIDTLDVISELKWDCLMLVEYDTVIFSRIKVENMTTMLAAHYAGGPTWGSKASCFYHNPWVFKREIVPEFIEAGRKAIKEGICGERSGYALAGPEGSPDVFFAYIAEQLKCPVQRDLWTEYSRNDLRAGDRMDGAIKAYQEDVDVIHGIKTSEELFIIMAIT